jgi:pseudouridine-5'-phosphate glycosidase
MLKEYIDIKEEVRLALEEGNPVVALESTIISHGMPYPKNVETALKVENIVRENGAIPATIGIIGGRIKVGLTEDEIVYLGKSKEVIKTSRRDIPFVLAKGMDGATTVASTMIIANLAGIKVFATGGIGGVHRKAQETFDISADLEELAHTSVAVVCAGAKSILDIGLTLEYLETAGVPVVGYKTDEFPAFYTSKSGFKVDYRVDTSEELAKAIKIKWDLGLNGGLVIGNPIPKEYEMNHMIINEAIEKALEEAEKMGVKGKETTPFLLAKVKEITGGESLNSNIQLVYNNAKVASELAVEISKLYVK